MYLLADTLSGQELKTLKTVWGEGINADSWPTQELKIICDKVRHIKKILLLNYSKSDRRLFYQDGLGVPDYQELQLRLIRIPNKSPAPGKPSRLMILELIDRELYSDRMRAELDMFLRICHNYRKPEQHNISCLGTWKSYRYRKRNLMTYR